MVHRLFRDTGCPLWNTVCYEQASSPYLFGSSQHSLGERESLRLFIKHFSKVKLNICNLNLEVALHHLVIALRYGSFVDSLCKKFVTILDDLRIRAIKFMQMDELREFRNIVRAKTSSHDKRPFDNLKPQNTCVSAITCH